MSRTRAAQGAFALGAAAYVAAVLTFSQSPGPRAWALHLPGFLPDPLRTFVLALLVAGAGLLAIDFMRGAPGGTEVSGAGGRGAKRRAAREQTAQHFRVPGWLGWILLLP